MASIEHPDRTGPTDEQRASGGDPASNRPMSIDEIRDTYADYAGRASRFEWIDRLVLGRYRRERFGDVDGKVMDVACGTGTNFRYLPASAEIVGIDVSPAMLAAAESQLDALGRDGTLREMDAQDLAFPDDSFDTVISSLSTCTFPDPVAALREMERVCKPSGSIRLVEHGRSDVGLLARFQEWREEAHYQKMGCRHTQEPRDVVASAGLSVTDVTAGLLGTITTFEIDPA